MLINILSNYSLIFLSIFLASFNLFSVSSPAQAAQINYEDNRNQSVGIFIEELDTLDVSKDTTGTDMGDDQVFRFIQGFSKNYWKDLHLFISNSALTYK